MSILHVIKILQTNVGTGRSGGCSELILACFAQQYDLIIGGNVLANGGGRSQRNGKVKCELSWATKEREKGPMWGLNLQPWHTLCNLLVLVKFYNISILIMWWECTPLHQYSVLE